MKPQFVTMAQAKRDYGIEYLGSVNSSAKIIKNKKVGQMTYILYLSPAKLSGYDVCPKSTPECRLGCLNTSGRNKMDESYTIHQRARKIRTRLFFENREYFMEWLIAELKSRFKSAIKQGFGFSVRLNGTSDIVWENIKLYGKTIFEYFPTVQFYDYTKISQRFKKELPSNYHLTYSYTGRNLFECIGLLKRNENVAVIFNIENEKELPKTWHGFKVLNGDLTDYRPADLKGCVIGLKWKKIKDDIDNDYVRFSCFVEQVNKNQKYMYPIFK